MRLTYVFTVTAEIMLREGGKPNSEALSDDVGDALRDAIEAITIDGSTYHATKEDIEVEWAGEIATVEFGSDE